MVSQLQVSRLDAAPQGAATRSGIAGATFGGRVSSQLPPMRSRRSIVRTRRLRIAVAIKRAFDVFVAGAALAFLAPVLLVLALLVKAHDGGPALYGHKRIGRQGREFRCWKFRSMVTNGDEVLARHLVENPEAAREWQETQKLAYDPRVTRIGQFLRVTSLDELPQLINVVRGEMSLVGPRPVTSKELDRYGADKKYYLAVRPGVTGLWQVSGRNRLSYPQRVKLDRSYVREWTLLWDVAILAKTVEVLLTRDGAC